MSKNYNESLQSFLQGDSAQSAYNAGKTVFNVVKQTKNDVKYVARPTNGIKQRARDLILQYPVLVSDALTAETVASITRSLEHEYAGLLTMLIQDSNIDVSGSTSEFLANFHNNLSESNIVTVNNLKEASLDLLVTDSEIFSESCLNDFTLERNVVEYLNEATKSSDKDEHERIKRERERQNWKLQDKERKNKEREDARKKKEDNIKRNLSTAKIGNNDIKKLDDRVPTIVDGQITMMIQGQPIKKDIKFGVKCLTHPLDSGELTAQLSTKVGNPSLLFKFIQWRSKEKKLFTDLIFDLNNMKALATSKNKNSYWFKKLQKMANSAETKKSFERFIKNAPFGIGSIVGKLVPSLNGQVPIPVVSLVVSKSEIDEVRNTTGLDVLRNPQFAQQIINKFYLLSFIIVDEITQTVYIFNDVNGTFNQFSIKQIKGFAKEDTLTPEEAMKKMR